MNDKGKRAVAYLRVSTMEQELGPLAQAKAIENWAERNNIILTAMFLDRGVSGGAAIEKRPALLAALDALKGVDVLVVATRDRLAREVMNAALIERMAQRSGATVESADGVGKGNSPEAFLQKAILDVLAQYERLVIGARIRAALAVKKSRQEKLGGLMPFGFRAPEGKLVEHDGEQTVIIMARKLRADGVSLRKIARALEASGHLSRGGKRFDPKQVQRMVA